MYDTELVDMLVSGYELRGVHNDLAPATVIVQAEFENQHTSLGSDEQAHRFVEPQSGGC